MRKLASIQKIISVVPIPEADSIECVEVLGWHVVVKKGEFKAGDLCVYIEIDSVLPKRPEFEFLEKVKYRVKTIRMRKQLSQGICFPLSILNTISTEEDIGKDVTEALEIVKHDPPEISGPGFVAGFTKGAFPGYVPKTDEVRIQAHPGLLEEIKDIPCYVSVKLDGTSSTFAIKDGEIDICSRNMSKKDYKSCIYWDMAKKYNIVKTLKKYDNIAIQGEIVGPGIQKNKLGLEEPCLFVFDVYDVKKAEYYSYKPLMAFCAENKLATVPIKYECIVGEKTINELLYMAKGKYANGHNQEGIVVRAVIEQQSNVLKGERLSFKVINNDYLLTRGRKSSGGAR